MNNLTAEQRQRMEENRKKALQKLSSTKGTQGGGSSTKGWSGGGGIGSAGPSAGGFGSTGTPGGALGSNRPLGGSFSSNGLSGGGLGSKGSSGSGSGSSSSSGGVFGSSSSFVNPLSKPNSHQSSNSKLNSVAAGTISKSPQKASYSLGASNIKPSSGGTQTLSSGGLSQPGNSVGVTQSASTGSKPGSKVCIGLEEARRIEENRRKALEKRAAQQLPSSSSSSSCINYVSGSNNQVAGKSASDFYKTSSNVTSELNKTTKSHSNPFSKSSGNNKTFPNYNYNRNTTAQGLPSSKLKAGQISNDKISAILNEPDEGPKPVSGKTITGTFRLMSRDRFVVEVGYHKQMLEVFKTMSSRKYDAETRRWNFCLTEHDSLVEALKPLRPGLCISPLPHFVRKTLQTVAKQIPASCVDLFGLDPKLLEALMPFQHDGVCFGVNLGGRVMIADDMGLGKTIQALGVAAYYRREWPLLIVTPSSVRYSWVSAIERWVTTVSREDITVLNSGKDYIDNAQVVITSYDLLSRRAKELLDLNFQIVIMDESHMLKSFKTARYKAAAPIMKRARRVILLSGTPALSRPSELYTQISGIDPSLFPGFHDFGVRYCAGKQQQWGWDFSGSSNMEELQIILQARLMIRRLKSEVLHQLPPKQRMMVILDPGMIKSKTKAMEAAAKQFDEKSLKGGEKHGALLQFFAESAVAKLKAVSEYIKELLEGESKFLVFAHHRVMLDKVCETCDNVKARYIRIDGRTSGDMRQQLVNKFQTNDDVRVAVLSITAANAGITLTAAQLVVFAEVFWNPGILVQAEDRAHRIGQEDSVTVQYLVGQGTVDDIIWPLVQSKLEVLSKAGLSKETCLDGDATYQKDQDHGSIEKYLVSLGSTEEIPEDPTDPDEPAPQARSGRKGGIQNYFSQVGKTNEDEDDDSNDEPQTKKTKI